MILHFDADAFFASVEQAADPRLRGRAVAVGGEKRGIIASASYEARKLGIYTPMPTSRARKLCPGLIVLPCDFDKYERFSQLMFSYAYDFTPVVEQASIDECYLDLSGARQHRAGDAASKMQRAIAQSLKLPVSVGVGSNKLVSQIASKLRKPRCFIEVSPGHEQGFLWPLENKWLPLVGPQLATRLNTAGLRRVEHIARTPVEELALLVGGGASALHDYAMGVDLRPVVSEAPAARSYGEQDTFGQDTTDTAFILARLRTMADGLMRRVREDGKSIRTVTLRLRYNDMDEVTRSVSLEEPTDLENDLYPLLPALLKRAWERRVSVRLVGLRLTKVYDAGFCSRLILDVSDAKRERLHALSLVLDELKRDQRSILRGHDLWLQQVRQSPRPQLPRPKPVTASTPAPTNRVLRERPGAGASPEIWVPRQTSTARAALNVKSCFSFLDSTLTIPAIIQAAVEQEVGTVALTDPNLHAAVPFFQAATAAGLKPILGAELLCDRQPVLAYVKNAQGYQHLCRLLSLNNGNGVTAKILREHSEGLWISSHDAQFVTPQEIRFKDAEERQFFDVLQSMKTLTLLKEAHPQKRHGDFSFRAQPQPDFVEECEFSFDFQKLHFPRYSPADGSTPGAMLHQLAFEGLQKRYSKHWEKHQAQLREELSIIAEVGYEEYFLTVWQLLQDCAARGIQWITRGSAADSLVCYCLGISNVCPIRFELYFKRFLNRDRMALQKLPDIDIDFAHDEKDRVVQMLLNRYGPEHAAIVGGFSTFQARSALADIAKVFGVAEAEIRRLTKHLPWTDARHAADAVALSRECSDAAWLEEPLRTTLLMAGQLDGFPRHPKMHPCGVVLSSLPIHQLTPTFVSQKGWPTTHFDMDAVEAVGLIKLDILAQGGLAVLRDTQATLSSQGQNVDLAALEVGGTGGTETPVRPASAPSPPLPPWSDPGVWEMIATGNARGVHHIESPAMTSLACMAGVRDIDQLVAIVSVIRPGAANGLKKAQFARRAQGLEAIDYAHPSLASVLRSTYGVVAYEEHILQICEAFAGLTPGRADVLRRALVKLDLGKVAEIREEFVAAARSQGRDDASIERVWHLVSGFQGYAFCRAHSTAYAVEAYQGAYMKHYHPAEFLAGVLTNGKGFYSPLVYTLECRRLGIGFLSPDINQPGESFTVEPRPANPGTPAPALGKSIRPPLRSIKDLGERTMERWRQELARQPFANVRDFCDRLRPDGPEVLNLIRAGAFDSLGDSRTGQFWHALHSNHAASLGTEGLFKDSPQDQLRAQFREEPTYLQRLQDEMELFSYTLSGHPLDAFPEVDWSSYCPIADLHRYPNQRVTVCGLIIVSRSHLQQDGQPMKFISIADRTGIVECEIFAAAYRAYGLATVRHPVVQVTGEVRPFDNGQGFTLEVRRVEKARMMPPFAAPP